LWKVDANRGKAVTMSWTIVFLLIGFWVLALVNGCLFGGIMHILLVYAGLIAFARFLQRGRPSPVK
jgi:hypothetical protein